MYCDLPKVRWWNGMKKDIVKFVAKCPIVKILNLSIKILDIYPKIISFPHRRWNFNMEFIIGLPRTR